MMVILDRDKVQDKLTVCKGKKNGDISPPSDAPDRKTDWQSARAHNLLEM